MSLNLFDEKVFFDGIELKNKEEVLQFITDELVKIERVENPERILQKFHDKEKETTTFLGSKFAIPHLKSAKVIKNTIVFLRLKEAIDWNEAGEKVKYIFAVLIKPSYDDLFIDILMSTSRKIIDKNKIEILKKSENIEEIKELINLIY